MLSQFDVAYFIVRCLVQQLLMNDLSAAVEASLELQKAKQASGTEGSSSAASRASIDYSKKFDNIIDSDDEDPSQTSDKNVKSKKGIAEEIHTCGNCMKEGRGMSKCSVCKKVWYCNRACQVADCKRL